MKVQPFYDEETHTLTYVVWDEATRDAVVIDPVLDYDALSSQTAPTRVNQVTDYLREQGLRLHWVLETHAHADHLSGSQLLKRRFEAGVVVGEKIADVQKLFAQVFDLPDSFPTDGSQFDRLVADNEVIEAGSLRIEVIATPGHTPACVTYRVDDALFTGDALFMDDYGTGRCDFPAGSAESLYESVHGKLYSLPDETRVFVGHDYQPGGREVRWETTIGASKRNNPQLRADTTREEFVRFRNERDATLRAPRLIYQSVQVNIDAGRLPPPHDNGQRYLRLPLNRARPTDEAGAALSDTAAAAE